MSYASTMNSLVAKLRLSGLSEYQQSLVDELTVLNVTEQKKAMKALVLGALGGNVIKPVEEPNNQVLH